MMLWTHLVHERMKVRGVWWIDFGPGVVTVDLNRLTAISNFDFYAEAGGCTFKTVG